MSPGSGHIGCPQLVKGFYLFKSSYIKEIGVLNNVDTCLQKYDRIGTTKTENPKMFYFVLKSVFILCFIQNFAIFFLLILKVMEKIVHDYSIQRHKSRTDIKVKNVHLHVG